MMPSSELPITNPKIGILWGDFPWSEPPRKVGKLLSMGTVARNVTKALSTSGCVIPYTPPSVDTSTATHKDILAKFLQSVDILWADLYPASASAVQVRHELQLSLPIVFFAGGVMPKGAEAMLFPWQEMLRLNDHLVFTSKADLAIWRRLVAWSNLHEWVVPLGIDDTIFYPRNKEECLETRLQHRLPIDIPVLLYVGRYNVQKNLHTLLRMLASVLYEVPRVHLCFVGTEDDVVLGEFHVQNTGYIAWIKEQAQKLNVETNITFLEPQFGNDLAKIYSAADILVNVSIYHRENFGLAQAEAQACGLPIVCTSWGGFKDVVLDGKTGYLIDTIITKHGIRVDWATGAQRIVKLLTNEAIYTQMCTEAIQWANTQFSGYTFKSELSKIVTTCLNLKAPERSSSQSPYEPSLFAQHYENHKSACGWYLTESSHSNSTIEPYPPLMFQGRDYSIYETLMEPYATYKADTLLISAIQDIWIPYICDYIEFNQLRQLVCNNGPIWRHHRYLSQFDWLVLQQIDSNRSIRDIINLLTRSTNQTIENEILKTLWRLHVEGYIIFKRNF